MDQPSVYFKVLGPVTAVCREGRLPLGGGKKRTLLAVLLLHANEVVSLYQLVDAIWGSAPCDSAVQQVRGLVCAVRNQALALWNGRAALGGASGTFNRKGSRSP